MNATACNGRDPGTATFLTRGRHDEGSSQSGGRYSRMAAWLAELGLDALGDRRVDYIGGLEMGAVPLAVAMAQLSFLKGQPIAAFFVRKQAKDHGAQKLVEGLGRSESLKGRNVVIIEDVTTTGESALRAVEAVKREGANIVLVLSVVDRQEGAAENFRQAGFRFQSLFTAAQFLTDQEPR